MGPGCLGGLFLWLSGGFRSLEDGFQMVVQGAALGGAVLLYQGVAQGLTVGGLQHKGKAEAGLNGGAQVYLLKGVGIPGPQSVDRRRIAFVLADMATLQKPKLLLLDEHTAALDPKTAAKVLEITDMIVNRDHLTTLMITHNMKDAIAHGNRLIMMMEGKIILDIQGEEKKKLTVKDLLDQFERASGEEFSNDSALLG